MNDTAITEEWQCYRCGQWKPVGLECRGVEDNYGGQHPATYERPDLPQRRRPASCDCLECERRGRRREH